jgi:E3 ubiquitin-protein ligase TRIP12
LFEQGLLIFERLGPGRAVPMIHLETAHGDGPTREFFTLFSAEFCRASRRLWRNPALPDSGNVDPGLDGLFPRAAGDPQMFYIMGIMCAKALFLGCFVSIPFNPVFFEIAWGNIDRGTCAKIDPIMIQNLERREGLEGCVFVSPDVDEAELVPDGLCRDVTAENVDEYVRLVEERMMCREQADAFARGFGTALPWDATRVFSAAEFAKLLVGNQVEPFTLAGLEESVEISHGYDAQSPQIRWLFEVLVELDGGQRQNFMLFLTGMRFAPPDGLLGLSPRLSIARVALERAVDDVLPTVSTCAHYLKLPEYSRREVLRERVLLAIEKGCNGFAFE